MKLTKRIFALYLIGSVSFLAHAIPFRVASSMTLLSTAISAVTSYASIQKCGVYIAPEMTEAMHIALASGWTGINSGVTFWWLYGKTPQGRMRHAKRELDSISSVLSFDSIKKSDVPVDTFENDLLKRAERINARDPFPLIKTAADFEGHDERMKKIMSLLEKAREDIQFGDNRLLDRHTQLDAHAQEMGDIVKDILVKIKNRPEYAKHLKYNNEKHAQDHQVEAQNKQANAQKQMVRVGVASVIVSAISATAQGAIAVAKLAKSAIDPFNPFKK